MCNLSVKIKRRLTYVSIGLVFLFGGIEYAVILPTMWLYIQDRFKAEEYFLGLILSAFCISGLFSGPIFGRWSDVTRKTRLILLFANCWEIAGNVMYFLGISKWFLFSSRLVAGIGSGAEATLVAELARATPADKRTGVLSMFIAIRQFGLLIGPGFNLFLREFHFYIGPFLVDKYSAPGVFMAVLWTLLQFIILLCYYELPSLHDSAESKTTTTTTPYSSIPGAGRSNHSHQIPGSSNHNTDSVSTFGQSLPLNSSITYDEEFIESLDISSSYPQLLIKNKGLDLEHEDWHNSSDLIESAERFISIDDQVASASLKKRLAQGQTTAQFPAAYGSINGHASGDIRHASGDIGHENMEASLEPNIETTTSKSKSYPWSYYYNEYMREPVVVLLGIQFISFFNQVALETMITPLTEKYLNWGELENSLMYCGAGAQIIAVFFLVRWLSRRLLDRTMLLIGCSVLTVANGWLIWVIPNAVPGSMKANLAKFLVGLVLDMFALPFLIVCSVSLYSKVTRKETQGFSQGLRRSVCGVATIIGPLWAGAALPWPYIMIGVMFGLISMALIMLVVSFKCLNISSDIDDSEKATTSDDETKPLLT